MPEQNLNPDALATASRRYGEMQACVDAKDCEGCQHEASEVIRAYLSALPVQPEHQTNSKPNQNLELQPDTVNSVEELDGLPNFSYVQGHDGFKHVKTGSGNAWGMITMSSGSSLHDSTSIELPATVLHRPVVNDV